MREEPERFSVYVDGEKKAAIVVTQAEAGYVLTVGKHTLLAPTFDEAMKEVRGILLAENPFSQIELHDPEE